MKTILINAVAGCLTLFIGASVHGSYTYTTLDVPGASSTYAVGIDGSNIVGYYSNGSDYHSFSYDGSTYTTLGVPGATSTYAYGIDGGNIVGLYSDAGGTHGFSYDGTTYTTLDAPGAIDTRAYGIDGNSIVGYYNDGSGYHGFLATLDGTAVPHPRRSLDGVATTGRDVCDRQDASQTMRII